MKYYTQESQRRSRYIVLTLLVAFVVCATSMSYALVHGGSLVAAGAFLGAALTAVSYKLFKEIHTDRLRRKYG
jgi:membrane-associated phospholipid phosphatase